MLQVGAATVDITPPVGIAMAGYANRSGGAEGIDDPLRAEAVAFHDGESEAILLCCDLINGNAALLDDLHAALAAEGLTPEQILFAASHTHFGPQTLLDRVAVDARPLCERYREKLIERLVDVVTRARRSRRPARLHAGCIAIDQLAYNRRLRRPDGSVETVFVLPPPEGDWQYDAIDPELTVLQARDADDGAVIASRVDFACHPVTATDRSGWISADYPGHAKRLIEREHGGVAAFALGCAGDTVPLRRQGDHPRRLGQAVGGAALTAAAFADPLEAATIACAREHCTVELYSERPERFADFGDGEHDVVPIQALGIGDVLLLGLPGEHFAATGLALKRRLAPARVLPVSVCGGWGYWPPRAEYAAGGYEAGAAPYAPGSTEIVLEAVVAMARRVAGLSTRQVD